MGLRPNSAPAFAVASTRISPQMLHASQATIALAVMPDTPSDRPAPHFVEDAQPDPEPAAPSLSEPDPGVFQHSPATKDAQK